MNTIADLTYKIKATARLHRESFFLALILILSCTLSFGIGRLSVIYEREGEFNIEYPQTALTANILQNKEKQQTAFSPPPEASGGGDYVASKNGSKYFLPWCGGAHQIKESNRIYFASKEEAEAKGYEPAQNCKGI